MLDTSRLFSGESYQSGVQIVPASGRDQVVGELVQLAVTEAIFRALNQNPLERWHASFEEDDDGELRSLGKADESLLRDKASEIADVALDQNSTFTVIEDTGSSLVVDVEIQDKDANKRSAKPLHVVINGSRDSFVLA